VLYVFSLISVDVSPPVGFFDRVIHQPSKYAARIAQAFTATDPSVKIRREDLSEIDDIGQEPYLFTDGVGTISRQLGAMIWEELCKVRRDHGASAVEPSAVSDCYIFSLF
jgi:RNA-dependent RNA polymerase